MKRKYIALITALLVAGAAISGCSKQDTVTSTNEVISVSVDTGSAEEELSSEEEIGESIFVWTVDDIALLEGIITGVGDYELSITSDEIQAVDYDDSIILDVDIDLSEVDSTVAGEYDAVYLISANRDALLEYISENEIDLADNLLAELNTYAGDTAVIEVPVVVTVIVATEDNSGDADEDASETTETASADTGTNTCNGSEMPLKHKWS